MLDRRPALVAGAGLVLGLTALSHPINLVGLAFLLPWLIRPSMRWTLLLSTCLGALLAPPPLASIEDRQYVRGNATVVGLPRRTEEGTLVDLDLGGRTWRAKSSPCPELGLGDRVRVEGVGLPLREGSERYLLLHGITGRLDVRRIEPAASGPALWDLSKRWRTSFAAFCSRWLPAETAGLTQALSFDLNGELDAKTTENLRRTGTIHVVSASGLHVFLLAFGLMWALSALPIPRSAQISLLVGVLVLYAGATGLNPPVVRAALMSVLGLAAYLFRRERDALSALGLAGLIYLLWQPREVYDPGFQLSFVTVGAMALFLQPRATRRHLLRERGEDFLRASWVAWLASTPLVAYHFGTASLSALPANLLIALPVSAVVISALAGHLVSAVLPSLGVGLLTVVTGPMTAWVWVAVDWLSAQRWSSVELPGFSAYWLPLVYVLLLLTWRQRIAHAD